MNRGAPKYMPICKYLGECEFKNTEQRCDLVGECGDKVIVRRSLSSTNSPRK